jgi:predicted ester cyclase
MRGPAGARDPRRMNAEANKQVVRRFVDEYQTAAKQETFAELLHPDVVDRSRPPGIAEGADGVRQQFEAFRAAFPDFHAVIHDQIAEGDKVVTRKVFHGTHRGELMGIAPTGREVQIEVIDIVRVERGQIIEHWNVVDRLGLLQQLGALPAPALT